MSESHDKTLLDVRDLSVSFKTEDGVVRAVDNVSFSIKRGEVVGLVGESGCGKSVSAMSLVRLIPEPPGSIDGGQVLFEGADLLQLPVPALRKIRGKRIGFIFQEPMTALSPLHRIGSQLVETQLFHHDISKEEAWRKGVEWLDRVGIPEPEERMHSYPFQLSGGMRQRVMIATALILEPDLVIADEPTTALDVTIQAQVLDLLMDMKSRDMSVLLITHDMGIVWETCDRVMVMYASEVVEQGMRDDVFSRPGHPYTEALLKSIPALARRGERLEAIPGQVPSPLAYPGGCRFRDRCPYAFDRCGQEHPGLEAVNRRTARCFLARQRMTDTKGDGHV